LLPSLFLTLPATSQIYTLSLHDALPIASVAGNGFIDRATQSTEFARRCVDDAVRSRACRTGLRKLRSASNYWRIALRRLSSSSTCTLCVRRQVHRCAPRAPNERRQRSVAQRNLSDSRPTSKPSAPAPAAARRRTSASLVFRKPFRPDAPVDSVPVGRRFR